MEKGPSFQQGRLSPRGDVAPGWLAAQGGTSECSSSGGQVDPVDKIN